MEVINFKKKKMKSLRSKQQKAYQNAKICYICNKKFEDKHAKDKKYWKIRDHYHYTEDCGVAGHSICNLKYSIIIIYYKS